MSTYFPQEKPNTSYVTQLRLVRASNGQAVAGMVLGILAVVIEWGGLLTLGLAVSAIIFGAIGLSRSREVGLGHGQAVTGVTLGIIGGVLYLVWGLLSWGCSSWSRRTPASSGLPPHAVLASLPAPGGTPARR